MKITIELTEKEISVFKQKNGTYAYRIKDITVENIPDEEALLKDIELKVIKLTKNQITELK